MYKRSGFFARAARRSALAMGHPLSFALAVSCIVAWAICGPVFGFSDTWQLVINTATTIVTFLMVFLIQNSQNRDSHAVQLKLDELIRATRGAHNVMLNLEELSDQELADLHARYAALAQRAQTAMRRGRRDTGSPRFNTRDLK